MRKLLSILGSVLIVGSAAVPVVSCSADNGNDNNKEAASDQDYGNAILKYWQASVSIKLSTGASSISSDQVIKLLTRFSIKDLAMYLPTDKTITNFDMTSVKINLGGKTTFKINDVVPVSLTYKTFTSTVQNFTVQGSQATGQDYLNAIKNNIFNDSFNLYASSESGTLSAEEIKTLFTTQITKNATAANMAKWCANLDTEQYNINEFSVQVSGQADYKINDKANVNISYGEEKTITISKQVLAKDAQDIDFANALVWILTNKKYTNDYYLPEGESTTTTSAIDQEITKQLPATADDLTAALNESSGMKYKNYSNYKNNAVKIDVDLVKQMGSKIVKAGDFISVSVTYNQAKADEFDLKVKYTQATDIIFADALSDYLGTDRQIAVAQAGVSEAELSKKIMTLIPSDTKNFKPGYDYSGYDSKNVGLTFVNQSQTYKPGDTADIKVKYNDTQSKISVTFKIVLQDNDLNKYKLPVDYIVAKTSTKTPDVKSLKSQLLSDYADVVSQAVPGVTSADIKISSLKIKNADELSDDTKLKDITADTLVVTFTANTAKVTGTGTSEFSLATADLADLSAVISGQKLNLVNVNPNSPDALKVATNDVYQLIQTSGWWNSTEAIDSKIAVQISNKPETITPDQPITIVVKSLDQGAVLGNQTTVQLNGEYLNDFTSAKAGYQLSDDNKQVSISKQAYVMSSDGNERPIFDQILQNSYWKASPNSDSSIGLDYLRFNGDRVNSLEKTLDAIKADTQYLLQVPGVKAKLATDGDYNLKTMYLVGLKDGVTTGIKLDNNQTSDLTWILNLVSWSFTVKDGKIDINSVNYTINQNDYELSGIISQF